MGELCRRAKVPLPVAAIVGYTNAGKSTLVIKLPPFLGDRVRVPLQGFENKTILKRVNCEAPRESVCAIAKIAFFSPLLLQLHTRFCAAFAVFPTKQAQPRSARRSANRS